MILHSLIICISIFNLSCNCLIKYLTYWLVDYDEIIRLPCAGKYNILNNALIYYPNTNGYTIEDIERMNELDIIISIGNIEIASWKSNSDSCLYNNSNLTINSNNTNIYQYSINSFDAVQINCLNLLEIYTQGSSTYQRLYNFTIYMPVKSIKSFDVTSYKVILRRFNYSDKLLCSVELKIDDNYWSTDDEHEIQYHLNFFIPTVLLISFGGVAMLYYSRRMD